MEYIGFLKFFHYPNADENQNYHISYLKVSVAPCSGLPGMMGALSVMAGPGKGGFQVEMPQIGQGRGFKYTLLPTLAQEPQVCLHSPLPFLSGWPWCLASLASFSSHSISPHPLSLFPFPSRPRPHPALSQVLPLLPSLLLGIWCGCWLSKG